MDNDTQDESYYGQESTADEVKTVQERCREYYKMGKFVVVMNIDTQPFVYQVQRVENQMVTDDGVSQTTTNLKNPERITLQPGQTRLVPAYEADLMIKALIDKIVYSNRRADEADGRSPRESVMDPQTQHKYIKQIYQGTKDFFAEYNNTLKKSSVLDDLEDNEELDKAKDDAKKAKADMELAKIEADNLRRELEDLKKERNESEEPAKRPPGRPPKQAA
jgi:hypothetical protein